MNPLEQLLEKLHAAQLWEREISLQRNDYLKVKGSTDTNLYFVADGTLRVFIEDEKEEHTIRFAYQNNLFGALDSFVTEGPSDLYIQALKKCRLKKLSKAAFMTFIEGDEESRKLWQELMQLLIYQQLERERDLLTQSPAERYKRVLQRSPQLFQEVPHKYIASYLRMTPETLSRIKKS